MAEYWPEMQNDPDAIARIKKSVELLDAKEGMTVLDVGCHKQEASNYLTGCKYLGVDSEKLHPDTYQIDIDGGFKLKEQVDRILCLETLEHLLMPGGTLQSIHTHLRDQGLAVVSLPNEATVFHRIRSLLGTVDAECFVYGGKHLHLPSLRQCRRFLSEQFQILEEAYYISTEARGTRQSWFQHVLRLFPKRLLQLLANLFPSLFARGFIFKLKKKLS